MTLTLTSALRDQATAIYNSWINGHKQTAEAMLNQVPRERIAYVVFTMAVLAIHDGDQYAFSRFIEGVTR
ncbi:MAG: hypothetical protein D6698_01775 [Gammaproteobacteria bacterium]|nr:MAG: hypothetical protein D6698_01775 [Gammaproteobacteria bacterium]